MLLMIHYYVPGVMRISCWNKKEQLMRLMGKGTKKVQKNLNIQSILAQLGELKMIIFQRM